MAKKILPPIHLACSDDELRPALMYVEVKKGIATATNAHCIAQLNLSQHSDLDDVTIKKLNGKMIHKDIWSAISDASIISVDGDILHYERDEVRCDYDISCSYKFPDYKNIINAVANSIFDKKSFVAFNPKLIAIANKIFPSENLIIRFYANNEMMLIFPSGDTKGFVGVMPIKISEEEAVIDFSLS